MQRLKKLNVIILIISSVIAIIITIATTEIQSNAVQDRQTTAPKQLVSQEFNECSIPFDADKLTFNKKESYMLMKIAMAEAESESTEGKALVMLVVLNRVLNESFPDSIQEVIFQTNQFTPVSNGRYDRCEPDEDCYKALNLVINGWDESEGAMYFESCENADNWHSRNLEFLFRMGNHNFYK